MKLFTKKKVINSQQNLNSYPTVISNAMYITGDMNCSGDIKIDGYLKGHLIAAGKIVIGPNGQFEGNIKAPYIVVQGILEGNIECLNLLNLKDTSKVVGEVYYKEIKIDQGAKLVGHLIELKTDEIQSLSKDIESLVQKIGANSLELVESISTDLRKKRKKYNKDIDPKDIELFPQQKFNSFSNW